MNPEHPRPIEILLVEDSPSDRLIAQEALQQAKILNTLQVVENGVEAMAYLKRQGKYASAKRPDLILLDLNLPKKDGREVLEEIKNDRQLAMIPVVILTTSKATEDVIQAYGNHANSYITKPVDFLQFTKVIRSIENYWFDIVTLPPAQSYNPLATPNRSPVKLSRLEPGQVLEVLLVEDSPTDVLLIRQALENSSLAKFNLTVVNRAGEVGRILASKPVDVIITDLGLPDSQGMETYRKIRASSAGLPILVLTGLDDEFLGIQALHEGAQEYLLKSQLTQHTLPRTLRYAIERNGIENHLRQAQKMEAIGRLSAGIAHDFNNILTVIQTRVDLLLREGHGKMDAESIFEIGAAADRAANLTRQLLTFSRQQVMQTTPLDLDEVVGNVGYMLRRILGENIRLELQHSAGLPPIEADLGMIEQVVINLALNARDAMPGGGKLTMGTLPIELTTEESKRHPEAYPGHFARLTVSDTGCGMTPEIMGKIFDPFFTTKDVGQGTGLGLATVFSIIQQHRGWIEVVSHVGQGSAFEIYLPASQAQARPHVESHRPSLTRGHETILLVEDEPAVRLVVKVILEEQGYTVFTATDGMDAVRIWDEQGEKIQLLLTDIVMPEEKSGLQLARELCAAHPGMKVIFTSGYSKDLLNKDFCLQEGVNFLQKPFELEKLLATVRAALDHPAP